MIHSASKRVESEFRRTRARGKRQVKNLPYKRAFTLLEVILALSLSLVVIAAVGSAIHMYAKLFDSGRTNIEEAQLARAILRRMADDIRGAVLHNAVDISQLVPETAGSLPIDGSNVSSPNANTGTPTPETSPQGNETEESQDPDAMMNETGLDESIVDEVTDLSATGPQTIPGIYGNSYQLQVDVSRLPRLDQYMQASQGNTDTTDFFAMSQSTDHISDLKNVAYYIYGDSAMIAMATDPGMQSMQMSCGLMRREMDRASALYASEMGQDLGLDDFAEVIAPEVESLQFAYFDGTEWYDTWDSTEYGGLPLAIQITISIARPRKPSGEMPPSGVYSLLVHIPIARVATESDMSSSTSEDASTTSEDSSTSDSTSQDTSSSSSQSSPPSSTPTPTPPIDSPQPKDPPKRPGRP